MVPVIRIHTPEQLAEAHRIRHLVFVEEQHCPPEEEYEHEEESIHFLASVNNVPCGTARWRQTEKGFKLERFAVLKEFRKMKVGEALLKAVLADVPRTAKIYLHAQLTARDFYLKYNFVPVGDHFWEAGIEHVKMEWLIP